jgi:ABC-type bacteriocin/lantibiotic exporter with double-glycine peptidase domain
LLDPHFRRALSYLRLFWRRLSLVLVLNFCSTGLSPAIPLLSRSLFDDAILGGDMAAFRRIVMLFVAITMASSSTSTWRVTRLICTKRRPTAICAPSRSTAT